MTAIEYLTADAAFRFFATLTFSSGGEKDGVPTKLRQRCMVLAWVRESAKLLGTHWKGFPWMMRSEQGETFGRDHWHGLLGGGTAKVTKSMCFRLMRSWNVLGGGHARVRLYCSSLRGVSYVLKGETAGADAYEHSKFGTAAEVLLSPKLTADIAKARLGHPKPSSHLGH